VELFQYVDEMAKKCARWNVISSRIGMCTPFLNKSEQLVLSNGFANKHVSMATSAQQ
jgi:hypothetical protein